MNEEKKQNLEIIKRLLVDEFGSKLLSIIIYGSTLNDDYCKFSDYDCLIIFDDVDFAMLRKLRNIKLVLKNQYKISIDFNSHIKTDLPEIRKKVFWHNNRGIYVQKELAIYGEVIYGKKIFEDIAIDNRAMLEEAVKDISSLNYQARKLLSNKALNTSSKILLMKWCIYGVLYYLATYNCFPDGRREALRTFDQKFSPAIKSEQFLDVKTKHPDFITRKEAELAFDFLKYLDKLIFARYQMEST